MIVVYVRNRGERSERRQAFAKEVVRVGRLPDRNDLVIAHPTVSRVHLEIRARPGRLVVRDAHSAGGSYLDGVVLRHQVELSPDSVIRIGSVELRASYELPEALEFPGEARGEADADRLLELAEAGDLSVGPDLWSDGRRRGDMECVYLGALMARPGPMAWHAVVFALDRLPSRRWSLARAVALGEEHLRRWPARARTAPPLWWDNVSGGIDEARWRLVRDLALDLDGLAKPGATELVLRTLAEGPMDQIASLSLRGNLSLRQLQVLSEVTLPGLSHFSLTDSNVGAGAVVLSAASWAWSSLSLRNCAVTDEGAAAVARSASSEVLRVLDLRDNLIGDEGARVLARSSKFKSLERLDLTGNPITPIGFRALRMSARLEGVDLKFGPPRR